jgi:hypothetical protein
MKNYVLAFALALLVVLAGMSLRTATGGTAALGIGGSPVPLPPKNAIGMVGIGGSPVPLPPKKALGIGGSPVPLPPKK